jgi:hypothetical protein
MHQEHATVLVPILTQGLQKSSRISTSRKLDQLSITLASREGYILQEKGGFWHSQFLGQGQGLLVIRHFEAHDRQ